MITFSKSYLLRISFQLLPTHTFYLYTKETRVNIQKPFQTTDVDLDYALISKVKLFVAIINGFYQILIVYTNPS